MKRRIMYNSGILVLLLSAAACSMQSDAGSGIVTPGESALLSSLSIRDITLNPPFTSNGFTYTALAENSVAETRFTPTAENGDAGIVCAENSVSSGTESSPWPLSIGSNTTNIDVTSGNGENTQVYSFDIYRLDTNQICIPDSGIDPWPIILGESDTWSNSDSDSTDILDNYSGVALSLDGPEFIYIFEALETQNVTVALSGMTVDLDIIVLSRSEGYICNNHNIGYDNVSVTFAAVAGSSYYFVVDGYNGAEGNFTITVSAS